MSRGKSIYLSQKEIALISEALSMLTDDYQDVHPNQRELDDLLFKIEKHRDFSEDLE